MPDIITANRLADGVVVFQTAESTWSEDFNDAEVLPDAAATKAASARAAEDAARNLVVDVYAVAVETRNGHVVPKALREAIRAAGPTVRRDLGKQAQGLGPRSAPIAVGDA
ncbi:uncharacterized protein DUF2849 [Roseiarcus fermentans]|uniref:Uncharacterized protein DUF2849 n=1 Tax=Roseiarcus fermentans TaxID=1473586 RepID=A0A366EME1_9HYPH|nr:DUF2849 domain-containing protein [Roseiarcus fermentans]RBP03558.1 uncharacterized protein DUF2849 [Roseiarcus fermentans]